MDANFGAAGDSLRFWPKGGPRFMTLSLTGMIIIARLNPP